MRIWMSILSINERSGKDIVDCRGCTIESMKHRLAVAERRFLYERERFTSRICSTAVWKTTAVCFYHVLHTELRVGCGQ